MGSFSWLKADTLTDRANIAYDAPFKFLIPKQFDSEGIGYISDCYRDYGYLSEPTEKQMADSSIPHHAKEGRYDMYELLAIWNSDYILPEEIEVYDFETKQNNTFATGTRVGDILKGVDPNNTMKDISSDTEFNRQIGIGIGCHDKDIDKLPYPLKLVSPNYKHSYEECVGRSYGDPNQGAPMTRNSLYKDSAFSSSKRYDGVPWKTLHDEWKETEMSKNKTKEIEKSDFMDKIYHIEGNTLIFNGGVKTIRYDDLHNFNDDLKSECENIQKIIIPDSVTEIGYFAFENCISLESITIPDSVTSIGYHAFDGCKSLESIAIPDSVTEIGYHAFEGCKSLKSIAIPDSVTSIVEWAFFGCESLTNVTIPNSVTRIGYSAFRNCKSLTSITIPNSITEIGCHAFEGCESLTSITIPDSVTSIGSDAFTYCRNITSINIPNSVTDIGSYAFFTCESLISITIPDSVTEIGEYTFFGCESLTNITIPDSVTEIGKYAFKYCESLTIKCNKDSYAEEYAKRYDIPVKHIKDKAKTIERE